MGNHRHHPTRVQPRSGGSGRRGREYTRRQADSRRQAYRRDRSGQNRRFAGSPLLSILFFPAVILYHELLLRLFDGDSPFFSLALLRILFFSLAAGLFIGLILELIPARGGARTAGVVLIAAGTVLVCVERGCRSMFHVYYGLTTMGAMGGDVVGEFGSTAFAVFVSILPFVALALIPLAIFVFLRRVIINDRPQAGSVRLMMAAALVACQMLGFLLSFLGARATYTYDFTVNNGIPEFGVVNSLRLEMEYAVFGTPQRDLSGFREDPGAVTTKAPPEDPDVTADPNVEETVSPTEAPIVYGYNTMDIDFEALAANSSGTLQSMHEYFGSLTPSQQNQYTGMFKGKNLIFITAEAFSPYVISEDLTPTLYKLSHNGFVFNNYYQPDWTQSTVGGEFANDTGIIPNWIDGGWAVNAAIGNEMPFTLGNQFAKLGYSVPAWHNHTYTYYNRDQYLATFGYDYHGIGNGLVLPSDTWPNSDLEMIEVTADSYIDAYVSTGTPFHAYYMSVSGHALYNFMGNAMSKKNREAAQAAYPNASETVQAYIACNLELEAAMTSLVDKLEAAGIADDTLIVLGADHYPYAMAEGDVDYYNELAGTNDSEMVTSRYRNTLIMWSACIEEPIVVDAPCYSCDIVPTISNLFGLEYDSRLLIGRDALATNYEADQYSSCMPLVVFASNHNQGNSWITAAGTYEASTRTFTPNSGITVADDYVDRVNNLVAGKISYSKLLLSEDYYAKVFG